MKKCEKCGQRYFAGALGSEFLNLQGRVVWVCSSCIFQLGERE